MLEKIEPIIKFVNDNILTLLGGILNIITTIVTLRVTLREKKQKKKKIKKDTHSKKKKHL